MDFHQLTYFNTVATLQNMSRASEILHVSQPSLSKKISKLEEELGYPLFDRNGKNLTLNSAGIKFLEYSKKALSVLDEGVTEAAAESKSPQHRISIGSVGECGRLIKCIAAYRKAHPETLFDVNSELSGDVIPDINKFDLIICPDTNKFEVLQGLPFYTEKHFLAVNGNHRLAGEIAVKIKDLDDLDAVFVKKGESIESAMWGVQVLGIRLGKIHFVSSRELQRQFIAEGIACGFVPEGAIDDYSGCGNIVLLPITDKRFNAEMKIAFKRDKHLTPEAKEFCGFVKEYFRL